MTIQVTKVYAEATLTIFYKNIFQEHVGVKFFLIKNTEEQFSLKIIQKVLSDKM